MGEGRRLMAPAQHVPVLLNRIAELLEPALRQPEAIFVDATLGLAGHSIELLRRYPHLRLVGIDRDPNALERAESRLTPFADRIQLSHAVYDELPHVLSRFGHDRVDGILFDLGVSSMQLDFAERGFAYAEDAPLDMRMDNTLGFTAADVLNEYSVPQLRGIFARYGEERFALPIARAIEKERAKAPFSNSARLVELIRENIPAAARRQGGHPAKRVFQALRIEVNDELAALESALPASIAAIRLRGRVVAMSYQSLEDRLVKRAFTAGATSPAPPDLPVVPESMQPQLRLLTRGAEKASEAEVLENPRAASVRVRAVERVVEVAA